MSDDVVTPLPGVEALRGLGRGIKGGLTLIVILAAWEAFARSGVVSSFLLPPLSVVLERVWDDAASGDLAINLAQTLYRMAVGFAISAVLGIVLGILIARSRATRWFFDPIISIGFPMPKIAFLPVFMLWFGLYDASKITMIVFSAIFPVVTATVTSTGGVEKELLWSARSLGASERRLLWEIVLPAALPQILTGLQVALPVSMIVAVVTEILMGGAGIGGAMIQASRFADSPGVFAGIIEIAVAGYCFVKGISWVRRRLLVWHQEAAEPSTV
ncbi:MAG TPA: ABC transporter permease [Stellaceae bacterium]|jgi:ABC-type nitrate/sulfonate/bicarbonate transport system permease component